MYRVVIKSRNDSILHTFSAPEALFRLSTIQIETDINIENKGVEAATCITREVLLTWKDEDDRTLGGITVTTSEIIVCNT